MCNGPLKANCSDTPDFYLFTDDVVVQSTPFMTNSACFTRFQRQTLFHVTSGQGVAVLDQSYFYERHPIVLGYHEVYASDQTESILNNKNSKCIEGDINMMIVGS